MADNDIKPGVINQVVNRVWSGVDCPNPLSQGAIWLSKSAKGKTRNRKKTTHKTRNSQSTLFQGSIWQEKERQNRIVCRFPPLRVAWYPRLSSMATIITNPFCRNNSIYEYTHPRVRTWIFHFDEGRSSSLVARSLIPPGIKCQEGICSRDRDGKLRV